MRAGEPITALTSYDYQFGRLADAAGVHLILVGDSLGMTMLGYPNTIPVTMEQMLLHTRAVARAVKRAMVVADMPFLSYRISPEKAMENAGRFLQEAGAEAVKLEGGVGVADTISRMTRAGIPVMGHIGLLPQSVLADGGYRVHGRSPEEAASLLADAEAVAAAGAFALVMEGIPRDLARTITARVDIPTIGIGAGPDCNGQIQVLHDILGLFGEFTPKHARRYAELGEMAAAAIASYRQDVESGAFPAEENGFR